MSINKNITLLRAAACSLALVAAMTFGATAWAGSIVGQLDFGGTWEPIDAAGDPVGPGDATGIRFDETEYPIILALGVFSHLAGQQVTIVTPEFQFTGPFPFTLWSADGGATYFQMEGITVVAQTANELNLRGDGTVFVDAQQYDGRYLFTGQGVLGFTFSSSTEAREVPAPGGLGLLGFGLIALAATRRRYFA
jgi:hypothetical protein